MTEVRLGKWYLAGGRKVKIVAYTGDSVIPYIGRASGSFFDDEGFDNDDIARELTVDEEASAVAEVESDLAEIDAVLMELAREAGESLTDD